MNKTKNTLIILISLILGMTAPVSAKYGRSISYESPKTLAMGGVAVAISDDHQALFSNPAGLGKRTQKAYGVLNVTGLRNNDYDSVDSAFAALSNKDTPGARISNNTNLLNAMGKIGFQTISNLSYYLGGNGFGMGVFYQQIEELSVENPINPTVRSRINKDLMLSGSIARSFNERQNMFRDRAAGWWGSTIKIASKKSADKTFYARDFSALTESVLKDTDQSGVALDIDLGALWQINNPWEPSFGIFVGNLIESEFSPEIGSAKRQYAAGFSIKPLSGPPERNDKLILAADYWDTGKDGSFLTKLRFGMNAKLSEWFSFQAGIRAGYLTGGFSADWNDARIELATYAEELGKRPGDKEDRRYAASLAFEF